MKTLEVGGSLALEFLAGLIKIEGSANYTSNESDNSSLETLAVHHKYDAFSVSLNPDTVSDVISRRSREQLPKIKATHVCSSIVIGGEATAELRITKR